MAAHEADADVAFCNPQTVADFPRRQSILVKERDQSTILLTEMREQAINALFYFMLIVYCVVGSNEHLSNVINATVS